MSVVPFRKGVAPMAGQHVCPLCMSFPCVCRPEPFGYAYVDFPRDGRAAIELAQYQWTKQRLRDSALLNGTREFPVYVESHVRSLLIAAYLAGIQEACPSRWPEVRETDKKPVIDLAKAYASKLFGDEQ